MNGRAVTFAAVSAMALVLNVATCRADAFGTGANAFTIDFVDVGNGGNPDDREGLTPLDGGHYGAPYGGVPNVYRIGITEVPQDWIDKATNLGLTNVAAGAWTGMHPAANITWYEAAAFVNWLNTSTGHHPAYDLTFFPNGSVSLHNWPEYLGPFTKIRHPDAYYFLPTEDEWYKAAYHKNDGITGNYWDFATGSNNIPTAVPNGTFAGTAVYNQPAGQSAPAPVDDNGGLSAYGTRGQNGNVQEWTEDWYLGNLNDFGIGDRVVRGGHFSSFGEDSALRPSVRSFRPLAFESEFTGFRVASMPEPSSATLALSTGLMLLGHRRRAGKALNQCR